MKWKKRTITGLKPNLSSDARSEKLKELSSRRSKKLHLLRRYIEHNLLMKDKSGKLIFKKMSVESFASSLGVKSGTWNRLERAESCLSIEAARWISLRVLEKFNVLVTPEWLLDEKEESNTNYLPMHINTDKFDVYSFLKDIYNIGDIKYHIDDSIQTIFETALEDTVNGNIITNKDVFFQKFIPVISNMTDKITVKQIQQISKNNTLSNDDRTLLEQQLRRVLVCQNNTDDSSISTIGNFLITDMYQKIQHNSIIAHVRDQKMTPVFQKGDVVGGVCFNHQTDNLNMLNKKDCIIELKKNSLKIIRRIYIKDDQTLIAVPISIQEEPNILNFNEIEKIGLICFRYKIFDKYELNEDNDNIIMLEENEMSDQ